LELRKNANNLVTIAFHINYWYISYYSNRDKPTVSIPRDGDGLGSTTNSLLIDEGTEELDGDSTVTPRLKVCHQRSKMELEPKMARRRTSNAEQLRR